MSAFAHFERVAQRIIAQGFERDRTRLEQGGLEGFMLLGEGHYSRVYHNVDYPGKVFKISGPSGFGHGSKNFYDRMWAAPGVPCADVWPTFAEFCMSPEGREAPVVTVNLLERVDADFCLAEMPHCSEPRRQGVAGSFNREFSNAELGVHMPPDWAIKLVAIEQREGFRRDIHSGNVLYDPTKKRDVLSDPWCAVANRAVEPPRDEPARGLFQRVVMPKPNRAGDMFDAMMLRGIDKREPRNIADKINWPMLERNRAEDPGKWAEMERVMKQMADVDLEIHKHRFFDLSPMHKRGELMIWDDFRPAQQVEMPPLEPIGPRRGQFFEPEPWKAKVRRSRKVMV